MFETTNQKMTKWCFRWPKAVEFPRCCPSVRGCGAPWIARAPLVSFRNGLVRPLLPQKYHVNPGWINRGLLIRGYSPNSHDLILKWFFYGTFPSKQPFGGKKNRISMDFPWWFTDPLFLRTWGQGRGDASLATSINKHHQKHSKSYTGWWF